MENKEYELLRDHIDLKFNALQKQLNAKYKEDKERDKRLDKIEKRIFAFMIILGVLTGGPGAIELFVKGIM